eukprot:7032369-Prymnesium_polylepis.1
MAGWDALNTKYIELGALDGIWQQGVAPFTRGAQYINLQVFPAWMMTGDRNDYKQMFETHNYFMSLKRKWRDGTGGREADSSTKQHDGTDGCDPAASRRNHQLSWPCTTATTACATSNSGS